jgi:plastocyanin
MKAMPIALLALAIALAGCGAPASPAAPSAAPTITTLPATSVAATATAPPPAPTPNPPTATPQLPPTATLAPSPTPAPPSPTPAPKEVMVVVRNFEFSPKFVTVTVGTKVTWLVEQGPHTATSDDFRSKGPNSWHSGDLQTGQRFSFVFDNPGTFRYFCGFHSAPGQPLTPANMNGTVTVTSP